MIRLVTRAALAAVFSLGAVFAADARPTIVELFTSQGCSACPAADKIAAKLAEDNSVLMLSFHVDYWNRNGWKDPFSAKAYTDRQTDYASMLALSSIFTPQMVIDGSYSVVGSQPQQVVDGIMKARESASDYPVTIVPDRTGKNLIISIGGAGAKLLPKDTDVWEVHFGRSALTMVDGGENSGQTLEGTNTVSALVALELAHSYTLPLNKFNDDGLAILVQTPQGKMIGAGVYIKPGRQSL